MIKYLKFIIIVVMFIFLSFSLALSVDRDKIFGEKTSVEKIPEGKVVPIPKVETTTPQNYHIPWSCLNGGGLDMSSTGYIAMVSSAQAFIGESQSTNYQLQIGYGYGGKPFLCGDANGTGDVSLSDIVYLISYLYKLGPEPDPLYCADVNGTGDVSISDIVYLISYLYKMGPAPIC